MFLIYRFRPEGHVEDGITLFLMNLTSNLRQTTLNRITYTFSSLCLPIRSNVSTSWRHSSDFTFSQGRQSSNYRKLSDSRLNGNVKKLTSQWIYYYRINYPTSFAPAMDCRTCRRNFFKRKFILSKKQWEKNFFDTKSARLSLISKKNIKYLKSSAAIIVVCVPWLRCHCAPFNFRSRFRII